jgi:hypothetical protein
MLLFVAWHTPVHPPLHPDVHFVDRDLLDCVQATGTLVLTVAAAGVPSGADTVFSFVLTNPTHNQLAPPQPLISATASIGFDVKPMRMPQGDVLVSDDRERLLCMCPRTLVPICPFAPHADWLSSCVVAARSGD